MSGPHYSDKHRGLTARNPAAPSNQIAHRPVRGVTTNRKTEDAGIGPAFVLWVLKQWWKVALPSGVVLACVAAAVVWYTYVPEYDAKALIVIEQVTPFIAFDVGKASGGGSAERYIQTQIELLRSLVVLGPVLARPEIAHLDELKQEIDPQDYLLEHLTIRQVGKSQLYVVNYVSPSAQAAADVANAVVAEYLSIQSDEQFKQSQRVIDILEEERRRRELDVERLRERVMELAKEVTGKDPFGHGMVTDVGKALGPVAALYQSLTEVDVERAVLKAEIQSLREAKTLIPDHAVASGLLDLQIDGQPEVREQQALLDQISDYMDSLKGVVIDWEHHGEYVRLQKDFESKSKKLAEIKQFLRQEMSKQRSDTRQQDRQRKIAAYEIEMVKLNVREKSLTARYAEHLEDLKSGGEKSVLLEFSRAKLVREEKVFELIAARKLALQTELRAPARVRLRQAATVASLPIAPIPYNMLLLSCTAALLAPLGLAVAREMTVRRISDAEQLHQESKLHILGEVTQFPVRPVATGTHVLSDRARREMFIYAESIDSLRTNLILSEEIRDSCVLAITSAASGEGKTSVSTSLVASIASASGQPTIIIDADLRSPDVAEVLGVKPLPGLAEVLMGKCSLREAIRQVGETKAYVLPAGRARMNPHHLVDSERVQKVLDHLRKDFSTILIDTPPVLGASESLVFAKLADTVIFCSLRNVSRVRKVHLAVERLEHAGAHIAGAILGGTPTHHYANVYGYYSNENQ